MWSLDPSACWDKGTALGGDHSEAALGCELLSPRPWCLEHLPRRQLVCAGARYREEFCSVVVGQREPASETISLFILISKRTHLH